VLLAVLLLGPQQQVRLASSRPDDLRAVAAVVAANERPGDAVCYAPSSARVVSIAYPAPFARLKDIALRRTPVASDTLLGIQVPARALPGRLSGVRRVWLITWRYRPRSLSATGRAELAAVSRMRLIGQWTVRSVRLSLYEAVGPGA
jgi:hypothetical protein